MGTSPAILGQGLPAAPPKKLHRLTSSSRLVLLGYPRESGEPQRPWQPFRFEIPTGYNGLSNTWRRLYIHEQIRGDSKSGSKDKPKSMWRACEGIRA